MDRDVSTHLATTAELDVATLYALLRLRSEVFVVEQHCPYQDIDGRDLEPATRHLWLTSDGAPGQVLAYLRLLSEPGGEARIGRVCTAKAARGQGLSAHLMAQALALVGERPCVLDAQAYLVGFYQRLGFVGVGPQFDEDGIAHLPMRRG